MTIPQDTRQYATETKRISFTFSFINVHGTNEITGTVPRQLSAKMHALMRELIEMERSHDWNSKESKP